VEYMKANHPELASLDESEWDFELGPEGSSGESGFKAYYKDVDANGSGIGYEFDWSGEVKRSYGYNWTVTEYSYNYIDYWDVNVTAVGSGTTVPKPGIYYVKPGESYKFRAEPKLSNDKNYRFVFEGWLVWNGVTEILVEDKILMGTAASNLRIIAVFEKRSTATCLVIYEDGLSGAILWRNRHVPLSVWMPLGSKYVTVTVVSDYGIYNRTFYVGVKNICIFFRSFWFEGDYTVTVTVVDAATGETYTPEHFVGIT